MKIRTGLSLFVCAAILLGVAIQSAQGAQPMAASGERQVGGGAVQPLIGVGLIAHKTPTVIAKAVTQPDATTATVKGIVSTNNSPATFWLACGTSRKSMAPTAKIEAQAKTVAITSTVKNLKPNTTYYFQLFASNAEGTTAGEIQSVTTGEQEASVAKTAPVKAPKPAKNATATNLTASLTR